MASISATQTPVKLPIAQTICAVIVTYHPDSGVGERIQRVAAQVTQTVIVDNGSPQSCLGQIRNLVDNGSIQLIQNSRNRGLAAALNSGVQWATSQGFRWVLTLDQDTAVAPEMVDALAEVIEGYGSPEKLAVVGSNYWDKVNGRLFFDATGDPIGSTGREMVSVLTSGSLVSVNAFETLGGFREDFFIDCVDHEYCLRARARGFHVVMTCKPVMEHGIGYLSEHRLLWKHVWTSNHSPIRQYFMTRNSIMLVCEYLAKEPRWIFGYLWAWLKSTLLILLCEEERIAKTKSMIRGCFDGLLRRTSVLD